MSESAESPRSVVPAQLNLLAIYSPVLGTREDNQRDQIVFHYSRAEHERRRSKSKDALSKEQTEKLEHDQFRQIGLAQGMLNFTRGFSDGSPLESVETDRHRIVLTEVEQEWWILASIDLTRLPSSRHSSADHTSFDPQYEYSSREVSPASLLIQQLRRAYRVFLLHHSHTLSDLYVRLPRQRFCDTLTRYWTDFALRWDVLLHGNPAVDAFGAIKLAAGGELGIGVGEEEWGSGEREVLEGLIRNTEGMLDMTASQYGHAQGRRNFTDREVPHAEPWLGGGLAPEPADGLVFSGIGHLTRDSLRDSLLWVDEIYREGEEAYGIKTNPTSVRRKRPRRRRPHTEEVDDGGKADKETEVKDEAPVPDVSEGRDNHARQSPESPAKEGNGTASIPPPIVTAVESSLKNATKPAGKRVQGKVADEEAYRLSSSIGGSDVWMKYLTLGYGSSWGRSKLSPLPESSAPKDFTASQSQSKTAEGSAEPKETMPLPAAASGHLDQGGRNTPSDSPIVSQRGRFLIGLTGEVDIEEKPPSSALPDDEDEAGSDWSSRLSVRTLHVSINKEETLPPSSEASSADSSTVRGRSASFQGEGSTQQLKLRVIVYAHAPFIYTFFFDPDCPLVTYPSFFQDLHHHLTPLHGPLLRSTSPRNVAARLRTSLPQPSASSNSQIHDLIYSPTNLTVRSTIPNIPSPRTAAAEGISSSDTLTDSATAWTRVEALSVHSRILDTIAETRARRRSARDEADLSVKPEERERNLKTSRGWWIVWTKVATTSESGDDTSTPRPTLGSEGDAGRKALGDDLDKAAATSATRDDSIHSSQIQSGHTGTVRGGDHTRERERDADYKEAILIRRSTDAASAGGRKSMFRARSPPSGSASIWSQSVQGMQGMSSSAFAPFARLAGTGAQTRHPTEQSPTPTSTADADTNEGRGVGGIGVDVPKYIEGLLSLSR